MKIKCIFPPPVGIQKFTGNPEHFSDPLICKYAHTKYVLCTAIRNQFIEFTEQRLLSSQNEISVNKCFNTLACSSLVPSVQ